MVAFAAAIDDASAAAPPATLSSVRVAWSVASLDEAGTGPEVSVAGAEDDGAAWRCVLSELDACTGAPGAVCRCIWLASVPASQSVPEKIVKQNGDTLLEIA